MKRKNSLFSFNPNNFSKCEICFMPKSGERSKFAVFISNRRDIDPNGVLDIIAHGNETLIEIENNSKTIRINARQAAKIIRKYPDFKNVNSVRLFSCNTGSLKNGFAQNLANALGKPVYAPNMTIYVDFRGNYRITDGIDKGEFVRFVPGGNKSGK